MTGIKKTFFCISIIFAILSQTLLAENTGINNIRYWFDKEEPITISVQDGDPILIPYVRDRRDVVGVLNVQVSDVTGNWSVPHRYFFMPSGNIDRLLSDNMTLTLSSKSGNLEKQVTVGKSQTTADIDVSDLGSGFYNMTATIANSNNGGILGLLNSFVYINTIGGNSMEGIYYWLNDSLSQMSEHSLNKAPIPLEATVDIAIDSRNIPSLDNRLSIIDETPHIAPNYKINVAFSNTGGFVADTTAWITDNSRRQKLTPLWLEASRQHDTDSAKTDTCYWYAFNAQDGDVVDFSVRRPCRAKLYDPTAVLLDSAEFTDNNKVLRQTISSSGTHYIQISEIEKSRQTYSAMLEYIAGPTATEIAENNGEINHSHDGRLISWEKASEWQTIDNGILLNKGDISLSAFKAEGHRTPFIADKSTQLRIFPGNTMQLESKEYIERVIFCLKNDADLALSKIGSENGQIAVDSLNKCVTWSGLSGNPMLTVSYTLTDEDAILPITRAFVNFSDLSHNDVVFENPDDFNYEHLPFNILHIWSGGELLSSHVISETSRLYFDSNALTVNNEGQTHLYPLESKLILTYEFSENTVATEDIEKDMTVIIRDNCIEFNSLPAFVGIYSVSGHTYFAKYISDTEFTYPIDKLSPGVYIIRVGDKISKMMIQ